MNADLRLPGISSAERVEGCPGSEVILDRVREATVDATRGVGIHDFVAAVLDRQENPEDALRGVDLRWHPTCARLDLAKIRSGIASNLRAEVAYALDLETETVRELGQYLGKEWPPTRATEQRGALDLEGLRADGHPIVKDIKTGNAVASAEKNWQLRFFGACKMLMTGAPLVEGQIAYVHEDGTVWLDAHEFTADELFEVPRDLGRMRRAVQSAHALFERTGRVEVRPGSYCRYCPGYLHCPAKTAMVHALVDTIRTARGRFAAMQPEEIARAWLLYEEARPIYERLETGLKDIARTRGIELPDGRAVRGIDVTKNHFSKMEALKLLRVKGASEDEIAACSRPVVEHHARVLSPKKDARVPRNVQISKESPNAKPLQP